MNMLVTSVGNMQFCIRMHFAQIEFRSPFFFLLLHILLAFAHGTARLGSPLNKSSSPGGANRHATQSIN